MGPTPFEAWAVAMGWSRRVAFRRAGQLEADGWVERHRLRKGEGTLLSVTRGGALRSGLPLSAPPRPAPMWWEHHSACAWTAAWLTARGREMQGPRELEVDDSWSGTIVWSDGNGRHELNHRPDLAWLIDGTRVAIEVELTRKSNARLDATLRHHARQRVERTSAGVIYICADAHGCDRVRTTAAPLGLSTEPRGGLRVETLHDITAAAISAWHHARDTSPGTGEA